MRRAARPPLAPGAAVVGLTLACWSPVLLGAFLNWDDWPVVVKNPYLTLRGWALLRWALTSTYNSCWQPVGWLLFAALRGAFGLRPIAFHAFNLLCHAAAAAGAYVLGWRLLAPAGRREAWAAAFGAAVFALHPIQSELLGLSSAPADALAATLIVWALAAFAFGRGGWALGLTLAAGSLRWLTALLIPAILALGLYPYRDPLGTARRARWILAVAPLTAVGMALAKKAEGFAPTTSPLAAWARAVALFLKSWVWPARLSPLYVLAEGRAPGGWPTAACALLALAALAAAFAARRRAPAAWPCALFCAASLLPTAMMSEGGRVFYHDRYGTFACLAVALALAGLARAALERPWGRVGGAVVVALLGAASFRQSGVYRDSETLWRAALAADPGEPLAYNRLGHALAVEEGKPCEALEAFRAQRRLDPSPLADDLVAAVGRLCDESRK